MQKWYLSLIVFVETIFLGFVGVFMGAIVSSGIVAYYSNNPIHIGGEMADIYEQFGIEPVLAFSRDITIFLNQFLIVFILLLLAVIYPMIKIFSLKIINALRA